MKRFCIVLFALCLIVVETQPAEAYPPADSLIRWQPYSEDTFAAARKANRLFFLLFTAEWCYWCHEYEARSLETREVAEILNSRYVPIVLDYDARADLRRKYRARGLPTTIILSPLGDILVAAPGFIPKARLVQNLKKTLALVEEGAPEQPRSAPRETTLTRTVPQWVDGVGREIRDAYDPEYGGFWGDAKLPRPDLVEYALTRDEAFWTDAALRSLEAVAGLRAPKPRKPRPTLEVLQKTLSEGRGPDGMAVLAALQRDDPLVGLYDPVDGGFFRYATQRDWGRPHFEKLLLDTAQMSRLYLMAYRRKGKEEFRRVAEKSLDYLLTTLWDEERGAFFNSQSADEVFYHGGVAARAKLPHPPVHRLITTVSNAEAVRALMAGERLLASPRFRRPAQRALEFLLGTMLTDRGLHQSFEVSVGRPAIDGQLADHAYLAKALLEAAESWGEPRYRRAAEALLAAADERLWDGAAGAYRERNSLSREAYRAGEERSDAKPPRANGVMVQALVVASRLTGKERYRRRAEAVLAYFASKSPDPQESPALLLAAHQLSRLRDAEEMASNPSER